MRFEQRPLETHGRGFGGGRDSLETDMVDRFSAQHSQSWSSEYTSCASFNTVQCIPPRHQAPAGGWRLGQGVGQNRRESLSSQSFYSSGHWWTQGNLNTVWYWVRNRQERSMGQNEEKLKLGKKPVSAKRKYFHDLRKEAVPRKLQTPSQREEN